MKSMENFNPFPVSISLYSPTKNQVSNDNGGEPANDFHYTQKFLIIIMNLKFYNKNMDIFVYSLVLQETVLRVIPVFGGPMRLLENVPFLPQHLLIEINY